MDERGEGQRERERGLSKGCSLPPSPFKKKQKKTITPPVSRNIRTSLLAFLLSSRGRKSKKTLSLSFFRTHHPHKKSTKALALLLCERILLSRGSDERTQKERECQRERESQRERVERNTSERRRRERRDFAFFLIFISPILNSVKGGF